MQELGLEEFCSTVVGGINIGKEPRRIICWPGKASNRQIQCERSRSRLIFLRYFDVSYLLSYFLMEYNLKLSTDLLNSFSPTDEPPGFILSIRNLILFDWPQPVEQFYSRINRECFPRITMLIIHSSLLAHLSMEKTARAQRIGFGYISLVAGGSRPI